MMNDYIKSSKLSDLLKKTFNCVFLPNDKETREELASTVNENDEFDLEKLITTRNKTLHSYLASLLPASVFKNEEARKEVIKGFENRAEPIEYGLPQICLEKLVDRKFQEKFEERSNNFLHSSKQYDDFNLVPDFLKKAQNMWTVNFEIDPNSAKKKIVAFTIEDFDEFTSRKKVNKNESENYDKHDNVGKLENNLALIYEIFAQGNYSKIFIAQKHGKEEALQLQDQEIKNYIDLGFKVICKKINAYGTETPIRNECQTEKEIDIQNYQLRQINNELQRLNHYIPWDLDDDFTKHKNGIYDSLLETLYNKCRLAPNNYKIDFSLYDETEKDKLNEWYEKIYNFVSTKNEKLIEEFNKKTEQLFVANPNALNVYDKANAIIQCEYFIKEGLKSLVTEQDNEVLNEIIEIYNIKRKDSVFKRLKDKWLQDHAGQIAPNGTVAQRVAASGMFSDDYNYQDDFASEDENSDLEAEEEFENPEEKTESEIDEEKDSLDSDFDNDSADVDFGTDALEDDNEDGDAEKNCSTCISLVEEKIKGLFNEKFNGDQEFLTFMNKCCDYALENFDYDNSKSNFENEYNAIASFFYNFHEDGSKKRETLNASKVLSFLRTVRKELFSELTDKQLDDYKKSIILIRGDFEDWYKGELN